MVRVGSRNILFLAFLAASTWLGGAVVAQNGKPGDSPASGSASPTQAPDDEVDPLKRAPSEKQKKQQKNALKRDLTKQYRKWLDEDVAWIISDEERAAFKQLSNDEERDPFIEAFLQSADPPPAHQ